MVRSGGEMVMNRGESVRTGGVMVRSGGEVVMNRGEMVSN